MQTKVRILFFCEDNGCNSQMAEGWARTLKSPLIEAASAGVVETRVDPLAVRVMAEVGIDIHRQRSKPVSALANPQFDLVICFSEAGSRLVPDLPGEPRHMMLDIEDPRPRVGTPVRPVALLDHYRSVRDEIREFIETLPEALVPANRKYYWIQPEFLRPEPRPSAEVRVAH